MAPSQCASLVGFAVEALAKAIRLMAGGWLHGTYLLLLLSKQALPPSSVHLLSGFAVEALAKVPAALLACCLVDTAAEINLRKGACAASESRRLHQNWCASLRCCLDCALWWA